MPRSVPASPAGVREVDPAVADATADRELQLLELEMKVKAVELDHARANAERMKKMNETHSVSASEVERAELAALRAEADFARARLSIDQFKAAVKIRRDRIKAGVEPVTPGDVGVGITPIVPGGFAPPPAPAVGSAPSPSGGIGLPPSVTPAPGMGAARPPMALPGMPGAPVPGPAAAPRGAMWEVGGVEDDATRKANDAVLQKLRKPLAKISFEGIGLADVLAALADKNGIDILVDWRTLEAEGISRDVPVSLKLNGEFPAEQVLRWVLRGAVGDVAGFAIDHGAIVVTTQNRLDEVTITRAYDPDGIDPQNLVALVRDLVAPNSGRVAGGRGAAVAAGDRVLITQTEPNHREIEKLVGLIRAKRTGGGKTGAAGPGANADQSGPTFNKNGIETLKDLPVVGETFQVRPPPAPAEPPRDGGRRP
jgi:hypothetical protein